MPQNITDDELLARVEQELRSAQDYMGGKLSVQRKKALQYYMAQAEGDLSPPEIEGRSTYVSTDVADTVEWMLPSLLKIFTAGDKTVVLVPRKRGAENLADDATEYLNYIFNYQNEGFKCLHTMFKDALISKVGILKVYWEDKAEEAREEYEGLSDSELAQLLDDDEVEPIEHSARPDEDAEKQREQAIQQLAGNLNQAAQAAQSGDQNAIQAVQQIQQQIQQIQSQQLPVLHDVTVKRTRKTAQVRIDPVPPEEFFISRTAKNIKEASFVAHVVERTLSDIRAMGYKVDDLELSSDDSGMVGRSIERAQRWSYDDSTAPYPNMVEASSDPSMKRVWCVEAYLKADVDGDGIAEWRRVLKVGTTILENEECDGPPFVAITPVPMPHRFFGLSIADLAMETQKHKTVLGRSAIDNVLIQSNGRYYAVEGQVNLDDLMTSRPGGIVRIKNPGAVGALQQGMADLGAIQSFLEYFEVQKENRTGFTRYSQGADSNSLNNTATGVSIVTNRSDMRTELIARNFAETGIKDLFQRILQLVCQYQHQKTEFQLNGRWLEVNPREWRHMFDVQINVGLGTNDTQAKIGQIQALMGMQQQLAQAGLVSPQKAYNSATEFVKALGYKDADRFFDNPKEMPPQQPKPDPNLLLIQAQADAARAKTDLDRQKAIEQFQLDREKLEAEIALKREELTMKFNFQKEQELYKQLYSQSEAFIDGTEAIAGNGAGPQGTGSIGQPDVSGSVQPVPGSFEQGVG